jgi:hypothetical protein
MPGSVWRTPPGACAWSASIASARTPSSPRPSTVGLETAPDTVYLRLQAEPVTVADPPPGFSPYWPSMLRSIHAKVSFSYSLDGVTYTPLGAPFVSKPGRWVGAQVGLFAQAPAGTPSNTATRIGWTDVDGFWLAGEEPTKSGQP